MLTCENRKKVNVLISAGPTREPIDAVRFISNFSTGELGVEIAKESYLRGYQTELLYGYGTTEVPGYLNVTRFTNTQDLLDKVLQRLPNIQVYISSAAVADYFPVYENKKISSDKDEMILKLAPTPKVLKQAHAAAREGTVFVAFKLEYNLSEEELLQKALHSYGQITPIIVINDLTKINQQEHCAAITYNGRVIKRVSSKKSLARAIFDLLENYALLNKG